MKAPLQRLCDCLAAWPVSRQYAAVLLGALLVASPALFMGRYWDDFEHYNRFYLQEAGIGEVFRAYEYVPQDTPDFVMEYLPWFADTGIHVHFFRPLSGLLIYLDFRVLGDSPVAHHAHSIFWYFCWLIAVSLVLRRLLPDRLWLLVFLFIALHPVATWNVTLLAARNAVVSTALSMFGVAAHLRWRQSGWRPGLPLSVVGYALGLLAGEAAVAAFGFVLAYEAHRFLSARDRSPHALDRPVRDAFAGVLPVSVVGLGYIVPYTAANFGIPTSSLYIQPFASPVEFLAALPSRLLFALGSFAATPEYNLLLTTGHATHHRYGDLVGGAYMTLGSLILAAILFCMAFCWRRMPPDARSGAGIMLCGAFISLFPMTTLLPSGRMVMTPGIGLTAFLVLSAWQWARQGGADEQARRQRLMRRAGMAVLVVFVASWQAQIGFMRHTSQMQTAYAMELPFPGNVPEMDAFVLRATGLWASNVIPLRVAYGQPLPAHWTFLTDTARDPKVTTLDDHRFLLSTGDAPILDGYISEVLGVSRRVFEPGYRIERKHFAVEIVDTHMGVPSRVLFDFRLPISDPSHLWLADINGRLARVVLPPPGQSDFVSNLAHFNADDGGHAE